jgi:hypothetical protein
MAGRASVVLRDQFEAAKRDLELRGTATALEEVRGMVILALGIVKERLQPIAKAAVHNDLAWLAATFTDWRAEFRQLQDEKRELKRLLDHIDLFLNLSVGD